MKARSVFLLLLLLSSFAHAQQRYRETQYTQVNGLPQNSINALHFTPGGFLWMATEGGLVRFSGEKFKVFSKQNVAEIRDDRIKLFVSDADGKLYAQGSKGEVFNIKEHTIAHISNGTYRYMIKGVLPSHNLLNRDEQWMFNTAIQNRLFLYPVQFAITGQNQYSILGRKCIYTYNKEGQIDSIELDILPQRYFTLNGTEYVFDKKKSLYRIERKASKAKLHLIYAFENGDENTQLIHKYVSRKVYLIQGEKLAEVRISDSHKVEVVPILDNLPENDEITDVDCYQDVVAVGTLSNGLYIYKKNLFETLLPNESINKSTKPYYAIDVDSKGNIYTARGQVFHLSGYREILLNGGRSSPETIKLVDDTSIYFAFADSIFRYNLGSKQAKFIYNTGKQDIISAIDVHGESVYASASKELVVLNPNASPQKYPYEQNLTERINHIYTTIDNVIYAGGCNGLFRADTQSAKMVNISPQLDFCVRYITQINDLLVVCTYGNGIWVRYRDKWIKLPSDRNNSIAKAHTFVCDYKNRIWISTNNGIIQTTLALVAQYVNDTNIVITYRKYDHYDGIINNEFNAGCQPAFTLDNYGRLAFPSMYGIVRFHPDDIAKQHTSKIYIDEILVEGLPIPIPDSIITIPTRTKNFTIELTWPNWQNPESITASYYLNNYVAAPTYISNTGSSISYSNLSGGNYPLYISLILNGTNRVEDNLELRVAVEYAFYETLWFRLLLVVGIAGLVFLLFQFYTLYIRRQNQLLEEQVSLRTIELDKMNQTLNAYNQQLVASEKELKQSISLKNRLISIITHDIITPLRFIAMVARNTESNTKQAELLSTLNDIHHTSIRLHDNAQNILNWIKHQTSKVEIRHTNVPLFAVVEEIVELLKDPAESVKVEIINNIELDKLIITDRNILSIIIHNIISNAVKYTRNATVNIGSVDNNGFTTITISDNGGGINQAMLLRINRVLNRKQSYFIDDTSGGHGLGFIIISELSQLIGADVEIQSSNQGTTVILKIPVTN